MMSILTWLLFLFFIVLQILDVLTTNKIIKTGIGYEVWLAKYVIDQFNTLPGLILMKGIGIFILLIIVYYHGSYWWIKILLILADCFYLWVINRNWNILEFGDL